MSSVPPDGSRRRSSAPNTDITGGHRTSRSAGSVTDSGLNDDGLSLTGPGAPGTRAGGFGSGSSQHPVRARLLERARMAQSTAPDSPSWSAEATSVPPPVAELTDEPGTDNEEPREPAELAAIRAAGVSVPLDPEVSDLPPSVDDIAPSEPIESPPEAVAATAPATQAATAREVLPSIGTRAVAAGEAPPPHLSALGVSSPIPPDVTSQLTPPPGAVMSELERIARRPTTKAQGPELSPNMTALLGGLVGLTVIVTLGLVLSKSESSRLGNRAPSVAVAEKTDAAAKEAVKPVRAKVAGPWRVQDDAQKPGYRLISGKIGKQAFLRAIQDAGLPKSEAYRAYTALKGTLDLDHCKSSDTFMALVSGSDKSLVGFEYVISKEEVYQAKPNDAGLLVGAKLDLKVERNQIRRAFSYDGKSFEESARRAGFDPGIADAAATTLRGHSAFSDFKAGDRFRIIAQEVTVLGEFSRYAGIEAMEIVRPGAEPRRIYYYSHPVEGGYFDTNGKAPYEGGWRKPIPDAPRTSPFNMKRMHPVLHKVMPHTGTDFGCSTGTPIGATSPGTVSFIGPGGPSGNLVKITHEGGYESGYAHLSRFVPGLKVGDHVDRMQLVGYCGTTGRSTGPHLHFTMKKDGQFIDAESLNLDGMRVLAKSHREEFAEVRSKYDPILDAIPLPPAAPPPSPEAEAAPSSPEGDLEDGEEAAEGAEDGGAEESADAGQLEADSPAAVAPAPAPAAAPAPAPSGAPAKAVAPGAIFLSDDELLRMQSLSDDGEVEP